MINLVEAAHLWPHLAHRQLFPLLRTYPELAIEGGGAALMRLAPLPDLDVELLFAIEWIFPDRDIDLDTGMTVLTERLVRETAGTIADSAAEAALHRRLSRHLTDVGRMAEALLADERSEEILREVAWDDPKRYLPELAWTLADYSAALANVGRLPEAISAAQDALWFRRNLVDTSDEQGRYDLLPEFAASFGTLGALLARADRPGEALDAVNEAIKLLRQDAAEMPVMLGLDLANAYAAQAGILASLGRWERALVAATKAVLVWRGRAAAEPSAYEPELGRTLCLQSECLSDVGRWDEALEAVTESVELLRRASEVQAHPNSCSSVTVNWCWRDCWLITAADGEVADDG